MRVDINKIKGSHWLKEDCVCVCVCIGVCVCVCVFEFGSFCALAWAYKLFSFLFIINAGQQWWQWLRTPAVQHVVVPNKPPNVHTYSHTHTVPTAQLALQGTGSGSRNNPVFVPSALKRGALIVSFFLSNSESMFSNLSSCFFLDHSHHFPHWKDKVKQRKC